METLQINIINPKAMVLLKNLADMNLIQIKTEKSKSELLELLDRLRKKSSVPPSLDEIVAEVKLARKARNEKY